MPIDIFRRVYQLVGKSLTLYPEHIGRTAPWKKRGAGVRPEFGCGLFLALKDFLKKRKKVIAFALFWWVCRGFCFVAIWAGLFLEFQCIGGILWWLVDGLSGFSGVP